MPVYALPDAVPAIDPAAWVHPMATIIGDVVISAGASIWPGAVLRGDFGAIVVGARTSVQDNAVLHATARGPTVVGADCVVGHGAVVEAAVIEDAVLIGAGSVVMGATVRCAGVVAAGAVVRGGLEIPGGQRAQGVPAQLVPSALTADDLRRDAARYVAMARRYRDAIDVT